MTSDPAPPARPDAGGGADSIVLTDAGARAFAVDPARNVVLEASAGTGKTRVLVTRYLNLISAGVDPANILAITFTRKAAAEMRERIVHELKRAAALSSAGRSRWHDLRDRLGDIAISTIDAFCLSLLREFPLEADLDPGFDVADETEIPGLLETVLDRTLRICRGLATRDDDVGLAFARLGERRTRVALGALIGRRLVTARALARFLAPVPASLTVDDACRRAAARLLASLDAVPGGRDQFLADGPMGSPRFRVLVSDVQRLSMTLPPPALRAASRSGGAARLHAVRGAEAPTCPPVPQGRSAYRPTRARGTWQPSPPLHPRSGTRFSPSTVISTCCSPAASGGCSSSRERSTRARSTPGRSSTSPRRLPGH